MDILNFIFNLLKDNIDNIGVVLLFIGILMFMWFKLDKKDLVRRVLFNLVVKSEKEFGSGTGLIKYNHVVDEFYKIIPSILKLFISRKMLDMYIEEAVEQVKNILADGVDLESNYTESYKIDKL